MRTFIAIELPANVKQRVLEHQRQLQRLLDDQATGAAFRWTPADNLHLTLRFLGETSATQRRQIEEALASIVATVPAFHLSLQATGAFPNLRRPNILWLDFAGELAVLSPLQRRIESAVQQAGFAAEARAFTPHLTIARALKNATPNLLARAGEALRTSTAVSPAAMPRAEGASFVVEAIHLIHSDLRSAGPVYTPLATFALAK
jgi:RNA 2',3'-cyclic 3'-phosphodiesterase